MLLLSHSRIVIAFTLSDSIFSYPPPPPHPIVVSSLSPALIVVLFLPLSDCSVTSLRNPPPPPHLLVVLLLSRYSLANVTVSPLSVQAELLLLHSVSVRTIHPP